MAMNLCPHINFGGNCREAFHFYEKCLGGELKTMLAWGDSPIAKDVPPEWHDKICHATLTVGASELAGVDDPFEPYEPPKGFQVLLEVDHADEAYQVFNTLSDSGTVLVPIHSTFWSSGYGIVVDRFSVRWEVSCHQPAPQPQINT
jgi:PhnB protein